MLIDTRRDCDPAKSRKMYYRSLFHERDHVHLRLIQIAIPDMPEIVHSSY